MGKKRFDKMLPIKTEAGVITGHIPDDWQVTITRGVEKIYPFEKCCQDPRNWQGRGDWQDLPDLNDVDGDYLQVDPWLYKGYVRARDVWCKCGVKMIATEYGHLATPTQVVYANFVRLQHGEWKEALERDEPFTPELRFTVGKRMPNVSAEALGFIAEGRYYQLHRHLAPPQHWIAQEVARGHIDQGK